MIVNKTCSGLSILIRSDEVKTGRFVEKISTLEHRANSLIITFAFAMQTTLYMHTKRDSLWFAVVDRAWTTSRTPLNVRKYGGGGEKIILKIFETI